MPAGKTGEQRMEQGSRERRAAQTERGLKGVLLRSEEPLFSLQEKKQASTPLCGRYTARQSERTQEPRRDRQVMGKKCNSPEEWRITEVKGEESFTQDGSSISLNYKLGAVEVTVKKDTPLIDGPPCN